MHFRWIAILGLALAMTGQQAEAARNDRGPVARPQASRSVAPSLSSRPAAPRAAVRPVVAPRGAAPARATVSRGINGRSIAARPAISPSAGRGTASRMTASRMNASRVNAGRATASRPALGARAGSGRDRAVLAQRGGRSDRHAALTSRGSFNRAGYHSAMLRGPSSRFSSMSACSTQRGQRVCGGSRTVAMRWSGGLPPAAGNQSSCPDGTMATMAVGHQNVVRCVPM